MKSLAKSLLENWTLKLTALFMAYVLWLLVRGDPGAMRVLSVPLEIRVPRYFEITSERPNTVDVTVRGSSATIAFSTSLPNYVIDMQSYSEGEYTVQLTPESVRFARTSGLEAIAVRPARLRVKLERTITKEIPVRIETRGEPAQGIDIYDRTATPARVLVTGPRSSIEKFEEVRTEPITVAGLRQSVRLFVSLDIRDEAVHSQPATPVVVNIQLGPHRRLQRIARVPVVPDDERFTVLPGWVTVLARVPITYTKPFAAADFLATVPGSSVPPDQAAAKMRPVVKLRNIQDPTVVIDDVLPLEVTVVRKR